MRPRDLGAAAVLVALSLLFAGCVMPDQLSRLQKDVADVQQQLRGMQRAQTENRDKLVQIESRIEDDRGGVQRMEFADLLLQVEQIDRDVAILEEQIRDTNRRMDGISQDSLVLREMVRQKRSVAMPDGRAEQDLPAPDDGAGPRTGSSDAIPSPEALYNAAYADFSKGNYPLAVSGFEEYTNRYPESDLADNAFYWVGECHFSQGAFDRAIASFDSLLERYPESDRAAAADLKKGLAYLEQNQVGKAIVQLRYVLATYPSGDEARVAGDKLASLGAAER